ncbi:MAG: hypothetical protein ACPG19_09160 [Saprospiraceae bacterium]
MKNQSLFLVLIAFMICSLNADAQRFKLPKKKKNKTEIPSGECSDENLSFKQKTKIKARSAGEFTLRKIANALTKSKDDLTTVAATVMYIDNLMPRKYFSSSSKTDEWKWCGGGDALSVQLTNREGMGLAKLNGEIKYNGTPFEYAGVGNYFKSFPANQSGQIKVELGNVSEAIWMSPPKEIAILSINGQKKGESITINTDEDIELELDFEEAGQEDEGTFTLNLVARVPPTKTKIQYEIAVFKGKSKVIIPKEVFVNYSGSGGKLFKNNCLTVTRSFEEVKEIEGIGAIRTLMVAQDWTPVTIEDNIDRVGLGYTASTAIEYKNEANGITTNISKPNAFYGQPMTDGKKLAIASVVVKGSLSAEKHSKDMITKYKLELPKPALEQIAAEAYAEFQKEIKANWNVEIVGIEEVMQSSVYQGLKDYAMANSDDYITVPYKNCKTMIPTTLNELIKSGSVSFPADNPMVRLKRDLKVDAVAALVIDFRTVMAKETQEVSVVPSISFKIIGDTRSPQFGPTVFSQGQLKSESIPYEEALKQVEGGVNQLNLLLKKDQMMPEIGKAIKKIKSEEADKGYLKIWKLVE